MRKKRTKSKQAFACLAVVCLIFPLLFTGCGGAKNNALPETEAGEASAAASPFSAGEVGQYARGVLEDGGSTYVNKWADIRISIPGDFSTGTKEDYDSVEAEKDTECGLYLIDESGSRRFFIGFQKLPTTVREEDYLNKVSHDLQEAAVKSDKMAVVAPEVYHFINLGGNKYVKASFRLIINGKTIFQDYYARFLDSYMIFAVSTGPAADQTDAMANLIRACG
ncbi:MAG: hypothetical protein J6Z79_01610 [Clostridia bacterium]|nr:hypothetical protein [Clostridia bacterium]